MDLQTEAVSTLIHVFGSAGSILRLEWVGNEGACAGMKDEGHVKYQICCMQHECGDGTRIWMAAGLRSTGVCMNHYCT